MKNSPIDSQKNISFALYVPALVWQALFLLVPIVIIVGFSIIQWHNGSFSITFSHYASLFNMVHARVILRTLLLALGTAFASLLVAYPVAYFLALRVERWKNLFLFLLTLPFWTNFLILVYSWFFLLERHGIINNAFMAIGLIKQPLNIANNLFAVFIVMLYCYLPFIIMPIYTSLSKIDYRMLEASADLGATSWQTFTRVTLPLSLPGIRTGLLLVMVPAFGDLAIPALVGGAKRMTVSSLISYYFLVVRDNGLGAAFTIMSGIVLCAVAIALYKCVHIPAYRR